MIFGPTPRVSVIIPTYNQCAMLSETLESVVAQTVRPAEVIVVDDSSTDATPDRFGNDARPKYIRQAKAGPSGARNASLAVSTGEFILSLDHDDELQPEYLKHVIWAFEQYPATRIVWINFAVAGTESHPDYLEAWSADPTVRSLPRHVAEFVNCHLPH
jgi:glycosyltransferase involved in cell wall biosynthesis